MIPLVVLGLVLVLLVAPLRRTFLGGGAWQFWLTALPVYEDKGKKLVHLGASFSHRTPDMLRLRQRPEIHLSPRFVDSGAFRSDKVDLFNAELAGVCGPFSAQAEYFGTAVDVSRAPGACLHGFYVQGSYFLTGEHRRYKTSSGTFDSVKPKRNFRQDGGWGAWEVASRYSYVDLSEGSLRGGSMMNGTVGLNWYLNPNVRISWNYIRSCLEALDNADIFGLRVQVTF